MSLPIYQATMSIEGGSARLVLNGFPVFELDGGDGGSGGSAPVNPWLCGARNRLEVEVDGAFAATGCLERHGGDGSNGAETALEFDGPGRFEFTTAGPDFSAELLDAPPFTDENALLDYALHLRDLFAAGDRAALLLEMAPKIEAYSRAFGHPPEGLRTMLQGVIEEFAAEGLRLDFERGDVRAIPVCGGRIHELKVGAAALFTTVPDAEGGSGSIAVYVAPRDGRLRIVR